MQELKGRHLRGITDFTEEEIEFTLEVSKQLKRDLKMGRAHRLLKGKIYSRTTVIFTCPAD